VQEEDSSVRETVGWMVKDFSDEQPSKRYLGSVVTGGGIAAVTRDAQSQKPMQVSCRRDWIKDAE